MDTHIKARFVSPGDVKMESTNECLETSSQNFVYAKLWWNLVHNVSDSLNIEGIIFSGRLRRSFVLFVKKIGPVTTSALYFSYAQ